MRPLEGLDFTPAPMPSGFGHLGANLRSSTIHYCLPYCPARAIEFVSLEIAKQKRKILLISVQVTKVCSMDGYILCRFLSVMPNLALDQRR